MATTGKWNGHAFKVSSQIIRGFTDLTIKGSSKTEDKTSGSHGYVSRKNSNPMEVSIVVTLNAATGCDVRNEAMAFVNEAYAGSNGYFYVGGQKLVTYKLMLTDASVEETQIAPNGKWVHCKVKLTMKQCDAPSSGSSSSGSSSSSKKSSTKTSSTSTLKNVASAAKNIVSTVASTAKKVVSAVSSVIKTVSTAKAVSSTIKKTTTVSTPAKKNIKNSVKMVMK